MNLWPPLERLREINWLLSLLAAIPLSIAANFITSWLQGWLARRSAVRARRRVRRLEADLAELGGYRQDPLRLTVVLQEAVVRLLLYVALASATATLGALPETLVPETSSIVLSATSALLYLLAVLRAMNVLRLVSRVRQYEAFQREVEAEVRTLNRVE